MSAPLRLSDALAARQGDAAPTYLGKRFDAAGAPLPDPGCTVIAHVKDKGANAALAAVPALMREQGVARPWAWLPPSSYHMTIFDLLLHGRRGAAWPAGLPQDMPGREADAAVIERLRGFDPGTEPPFRLKVEGLHVSPSGIGAALSGETAAEDARLRALRDRLAAATGLSARPGHADYRFHVTLAYLIDWPRPDEVEPAETALDRADRTLRATLPTLTLGAPEVCLFDDMFEFRPLFALAKT